MLLYMYHDTHFHSYGEGAKSTGFFLGSLDVLGGGRLRRDCPELELARELWDWGRATGFRPQEKGRGVLLDCACTRKPDCEEARLLAAA